MIIDEKLKVIWLHNPKCGGLFFRNAYAFVHKDGLEKIFKGYYSENTNTDLAHIDYGNLARFIPDYENYKIITFLRNPYNRFVSGWKTACERLGEIREIDQKMNGDIQRICRYIYGLNYFQQDRLLRSRRIPWLNPQTNYTRNNTTILRFESEADWQFIFRIFQLTGSEVKIPQDYHIDVETQAIIRKLYYDDESIFRLYEHKTTK